MPPANRAPSVRVMLNAPAAQPDRVNTPKHKPSFHSESFSQSNEADDERTPSEHSSIMGPDSEIMSAHAPPDMPLYEGEDTSLTSKRELRGFYMYGWAAEVFVVCGMASFIPITLEQLARERGWVEGDRSQSCKAGLEVPDTPFRNSTPIARPPHEVRQCIIDILGLEINTASFAMYTFSISVLVQALLIISISAAADHGKFRRKLLVTFAFTGSIATMLFLPVVPEYLGWGAVLAIIANTAFGASFVLLNSFLPLLVRHHESVQLVDDEISDEEDTYEVEDGHTYPSETSSLLNRTQSVLKPYYPPPPVTTSRELHTSTKISSYGMGIGYIAALIVQAASIITVRAMRSSLLSLRVALFVIGAWWFIFTIPAAMWLRSRPGPPLHLNPDQTRFGAGVAYFTYSWRSLWRSIKQARRLKDCLLFLGAWFLLSDAVATVSGTAILFAKTSLEMQPAALALITVTATLSGIVGAFSWGKVSNMMGLKPTHTIMACILLFETIPIYGLLGYIPAVRRWGVIGLQQPWEMYPLGIVYGFVMGGLSSFCRSLFGELIPPGFEAAFYALYAITDKGSSIFGPAIVGAITDAYGEIRPAFFFLAVLIGLPFPLMLFVDVERGRREGIALAKELEEAEALDAASAHQDAGLPVDLIDDEAGAAAAGSG